MLNQPMNRMPATQQMPTPPSLWQNVQNGVQNLGNQAQQMGAQFSQNPQGFIQGLGNQAYQGLQNFGQQAQNHYQQLPQGMQNFGNGLAAPVKDMFLNSLPILGGSAGSYLGGPQGGAYGTILGGGLSQYLKSTGPLVNPDPGQMGNLAGDQLAQYLQKQYLPSPQTQPQTQYPAGEWSTEHY
jgi:uncharacterized phage infection (PIP) family protein YhgE